MTQQIVITVGGTAGSGKTTVALIIDQALRDHGLYNVVTEATDEVLEEARECHNGRVIALRKVRPEITIRPEQVRRIG